MQAVRFLESNPIVYRLGFFSRTLDACIVLIGAAIAFSMRFDIFMSWTQPIMVLVAFNTAMSAILFPALGIYKASDRDSLWHVAMRIIVGWTTVFVIGIAFMVAVQQAFSVSRLWCCAWFAVTLALLIMVRSANHRLFHVAKSRTRVKMKSVAIVGANAYSRQLIEKLNRTPAGGFKCVSVFDDTPEAEQFTCGLPVVRSLDALAVAVRGGVIDELWLVTFREEARIQAILHEFKHEFVNIRFIPNVEGSALFNHAVDEVLGVPAINLLASPPADHRFLPKEVFDRLFAAAALISILPLMIAIAIMVKLSSPGPVFFRQWRKGVNGNKFQIYKFRTMVVHAEDAGKLTQARRHDPRVTAVGAFLRRMSLDELPQFINVLRGEMSVVGPRPHALQHDEQYKDLVHGYMCRYRIKPGITGWAQINGYRGETDHIDKMQGRVALDLNYIENWTFSLDLKIVLLTLLRGFRGLHAY
ncbi:undecaprenyl-phosphate glucose phosphotransferase [Paraburkholderia phenoliruptrix]|uniref:Colanic acid biosysnthesis UDP-glucose lipid carrier transferase n=2 Tax=Paraburkholderia phenoliruptrix TaxID=252970 RepID=K0E0X9_9BURK|nr:undecaprenyl-phosphate glucose phosphotransferase [Paraburkholderia phenoliruptrix]AFT90113.1 colanic acid biosysnthesis UDP-glucose lipid carrier transferase [Paraburkholderia phenoliruptrix BR3459a]CAB4052750.1 UDP-glucose:undecaprenyl-phosphate glucose-1-phosphate transferase [Paraburkholderia phenoliruptrix]